VEAKLTFEKYLKIIAFKCPPQFLFDLREHTIYRKTLQNVVPLYMVCSLFMMDSSDSCFYEIDQGGSEWTYPDFKEGKIVIWSSA
jgi:hypothetical protein